MLQCPPICPQRVTRPRLRHMMKIFLTATVIFAYNIIPTVTTPKPTPYPPNRAALHMTPEPIEEGQEFEDLHSSCDAGLGCRWSPQTLYLSVLNKTVPSASVPHSTRHWAVSKSSKSKMNTSMGRRLVAFITIIKIISLQMLQVRHFNLHIATHILVCVCVLVWLSQGHGDPRGMLTHAS